MAASEDPSSPIKPELGLWDAVSIIIGIVIGSSIYVTPIFINGHLDSPMAVMGTWVLGGVLCLVGALCYAELATAYPHMGGDYVYLNKAFGPWFGFQFGWAQLAVILTSSIGMMGFVFGQYAVKLCEIGKESSAAATVMFAVSAVVVLALVNVLGVVLGKTTQNILSIAKVIGLGAIIYAGFAWGQSSGAWVPHPATEGKNATFGTALILVLYAYGGWNDAAFVAADMRNRRHIPMTLLLGTGGVMLIYLLVNAAYINGLGFEKTQGFNPDPIAARTLALGGDWAAKAISALVMVSALGAINGLLFTGSRVCSALGREHRIFAELGRWNPRFGSPVLSLVALAVISIAMILGVGTETGRNAIDSGLGMVGISALPWDRYFGGFDTLFAGTAPVFWLFFLFTGLAVFVLRENDRGVERPFLVPFYPYLPTVFCGMCLFGLYSALKYAELVALIGLVPLLIGVPLYFFSQQMGPKVVTPPPAAEPEVPAPVGDDVPEPQPTPPA